MSGLLSAEGGPHPDGKRKGAGCRVAESGEWRVESAEWRVRGGGAGFDFAQPSLCHTTADRPSRAQDERVSAPTGAGAASAPEADQPVAGAAPLRRGGVE